MKFQTMKTVSTRASTIVGAVVITAVIVSAGQGVAHAAMAVANNSVNSAKIVDNSIQGIDIRNGTVASIDIKNSSIVGADVLDGSIEGVDIADGNVGIADLADDAVNGTIIADGSVGPDDLTAIARPRWARVDAGATVSLLSSRGATAATRTGVGTIVVAFNAAINTCSVTATTSSTVQNGFPNPGWVTVVPGANTNEVLLRTYGYTGVLQDLNDIDAVNIQVDC